MPPRLTKYSKYSKNKMKRSNNVHNEIVLDVIELDPLVDERMDLPGSLQGRDLKGCLTHPEKGGILREP